MKITEELLKRYVQGKCSDEEKRAIEKWMPDNVDITTDLSEAFLESEGDLMWKTISNRAQRKKRKVISLNRKVYQYAAVACISIFLSSTFYYFMGFFSQNKKIYDFRNQNETFLASNDLKFVTFEDSQVISSYEPAEELVKINFKGDFCISNDSAKDIKTEIVSYCDDTNSTRKTVTLKSGATYMVSRHQNKFDEVLVTDINKSHGLLPFQIHKIHKARSVDRLNKSDPDCSSTSTESFSI